MIRKNGEKYFIEKQFFPTIAEIIQYHVNTKEPISGKDNDTVLRNAIGRQAWELHHDDIEPMKKLGEGAYGMLLGYLKARPNLYYIQVKSTWESSN